MVNSQNATIRIRVDDTELQSLSRLAYLKGKEDAITDLASSGGLNTGRAAIELLFLLPSSFVDAYQRLFWTAFADEAESRGGGSKNDRDSVGKAKGKTKSGIVTGSETNLQVSGSGKRYRRLGLMIRNEGALGRKIWVDQKLDGMVQDILKSLRGEKLNTRQCGGVGCKRMMDWKWRFCPSCGWDRGEKR